MLGSKAWGFHALELKKHVVEYAGIKSMWHSSTGISGVSYHYLALFLF